MRMLLLDIRLLCLLILSAASLLLRSSAALADETIAIKTKTQTRKAILHFPNNKPQENLPVVLVFHGGGGNAAGIMQMTAMSAKADSAGFLAVFPEGNPALRILGARFETWNGGRCCGSAVENNNDDIGFISHLIDHLVSEFRVDQHRVYATGISNGAQIAYRASCELSEKIAAIAAVASIEVFEPCNPKRPVPILHIHGTADPCAIYNGGVCGQCFDKLLGKERSSDDPRGKWQCDAVPDFIERKRAQYHCKEPLPLTSASKSVSCSTSICDQHSEVMFCSVQGAGHTWPGGFTPVIGCLDNPTSKRCARYDAIVGKTSRDFNATDFIWKFFSGKSIRANESPTF